MRIVILFFFLFLNNCSLNKDSKYWTNDAVKKKEVKKILSKSLEKTENITTMNMEEYKIYIEDQTKKSQYPDISQ